jgi:hypothetical protein
MFIFCPLPGLSLGQTIASMSVAAHHVDHV